MDKYPRELIEQEKAERDRRLRRMRKGGQADAVRPDAASLNSDGLIPGQPAAMTADEPTRTPEDDEEAMKDRQRRLMARRRRNKVNLHKDMVAWAVTVFTAIVLAVMVKLFLFDFATVSGPSMLDTLVEGEQVILSRLPYSMGAIQRGDVVVCKYPNDLNNSYIKRVVGVPGDRVEIRDRQLFINDILIQESYVRYPTMASFGPVIVEEGRLMVMGDNRLVSYDSRSLGTIPISFVQGKALMVVTPLDRLRVIFSSDSLRELQGNP